MRRWIMGAGALLLLLFFGGKVFISGEGKTLFTEVLDSYNRARTGLKLELDEYRGDWRGAQARIRVVPEAGENALPPGVRRPLELNFSVTYGPWFFSPMGPGLLRIESRGSFSRWLRDDAKEAFLKAVPSDVGYRYLGVMDWWHVMHETIALTRIEAYDSRTREKVILEPLRIRSDYYPATLKGRAEFSSDGLTLLDGKRGERLELQKPRLEAEVREFNTTGPLFGRVRFSVAEVRALLKRPDPESLRFGISAEMDLKRRSPLLADLTLKSEAKALNETTRKAWKGLVESRGTLRLEGLGIAGIRKLEAMERERRRLRRELAKTVGAGDDIGMQKAILALQALDDGWIDAYNTLLIPGQTRLVLDERFRGEKESRLQLDLTFTGRKLPKDPFSAMVALTTEMNRLVEGQFDLQMEEKLLGRLFPEAKLILDSMVQKGLATLQEGIYRLKGSIEKGKIVINGTRYAPQELIMMILI